METTEIRFYSPRVGYGTELVQNSNPQAAINVVRAKIGPDARIVTMKTYATPAPTGPRDGGTGWCGRK